ncbi:MAG: hypothetical protein WDN30_09350 [Pararobbsia sp.]
MAVDFSLLPPEVPVPQKAPSPFVWSIVFVVLTLTGVALALWSWPRNMPTHQTLWFWFSIVVIPVCLAGAFVLRRFAHFYGRRNRALSDNRLGKAYLDMVFDAASMPLAVLAFDYRLHIDDEENTFDALVARSASPPTRPAKDSHHMIVASCLEPASAALTFDDEERQVAVLEWIFRSFAPAIVGVLDSVPERIPVEVHLEVSGAVLSHEAIHAVWKRLAMSAHASRLNAEPIGQPSGGLWFIDAMLDRTPPAPHDVVALRINVNLSLIRTADPEPGSTEAATMMLLCPAALARKEQLPVAGWFHRPQAEATAPPEGALHYALKWARTTGAALAGTFQTGFDQRSAAQLPVALQAAGRPVNGASSSDFVLDTLAGHAGTTAPWLAAVLALDRAVASAAPYVAGVQSEGQVLLAVLAPPGHHPQQDASER